MRKTLKRTLAILFAVDMMVGTTTLNGFVGIELSEFNLFKIKAEAAISGTCSENLIWSFDEVTGTLTITGSDAMDNYYYYYRAPWYDYRASVQSVVIDYGVTSIGDEAFYWCDSLASIVIPDSVTYIGDSAFNHCDALSSITIPDSVTCIKEGAFRYSGLTSVTIPESVTYIGDEAFMSEALTSITVDENNLYYSSDEHGVLFNKNKTTLMQYPAGKTKTNYVIPDGITSIGAYAFASCCGLANITIPTSVKNISDRAFWGCSFLKDIYYGGSEAEWKQITIGVENDSLTSADIHYSDIGGDDSTENPDVPGNPDNDPSDIDTSAVKTPTVTEIRYGDSIVLHVDPAKIPADGYVEWFADNNNFSYYVSADGSACVISPSSSGTSTFTALVYDAEGNIVATGKQEMKSKAGFFDKIVAFFKKLFGLTKTIPQAFKGIY